MTEHAFPTTGVIITPDDDKTSMARGNSIDDETGKQISHANPLPVAIIAGGEFAGTVAACTVADGADATQGTLADAAWSGSGAGTIVAILKAIWAKLAGASRTASIARVTDAGTVASGAKSVSVTNTGSAVATVLGATLKVGETVRFETQGNDTLAAIAYDATGSELLISKVA